MKSVVSVVALLVVALACVWLWPASPASPQVPHEPSAPTTVAPDVETLLGEVGADEPVRSAPVVADGQPASADPAPVGVATTVQMRFVDELGAAVASARVRALRTNPEVVAESAASGVATLSIPLEAQSRNTTPTFTFEVTALGYATDRRSAVVRPSETVLLGDWVLVAAGSIAGKVLDPSGRGVADAEVACLDPKMSAVTWSGRRNDELELLWRPGARTRTGRDGAFVLDGLPHGTLRLVAVARSWLAGATEPIELAPAQHLTDVVIQLGDAIAGRDIGGIVVRPDGSGVAFAPLHVRASGESRMLRTGADGRFRIRSLRGERYDLIALDPDQRLREASALQVRKGKLDLVLTLQQATSVELRVVSVEGEPIERFGVEMTSAEGDLSLASFPIASHSAGTMTLSVPARAFTLDVDAPGWMPQSIGPFEPDRLVEQLDIRLSPAVGLSGTVVADGQPVARATVALHAFAEQYTEYNGFPVRCEPSPAARAETDATGSFLIPVRTAGAYFARVEADGWALTEVGPLELSSTATRSARIELVRGGSIAVRVRSSEKRSVVGHVIALSRGDGRTRTARSDSDGRHVFDALTPGRWQVTLVDQEIDARYGATHVGSTPSEEIPSNCDVANGRTTVFDLWLEDRGLRTCTLVGEIQVDGRPAEGWQARLQQELGDRSASSVVTPDGVFRVSAARPDTYRLVLMPSDIDTSAMLMIFDQVRLVEGESRWRAALETGSIEGRVALAASPTPKLTFFQAERGSMRCLAPIVADGVGAFRCPRVPIGKGRIIRLDPRVQFDQQEPEELAVVEIEKGKTAAVEIR